jgi:hypothetical protein
MITADTITDAQIAALGLASVESGDFLTAMWCDFALIDDASRYSIPAGCDRAAARSVCAGRLNSRGTK